jgi:hypothetical protein
MASDVSFRAVRLFAAALLVAACGGNDEADTARIEPPPAALGVSDEQQPTPGFDVLQQGVFRRAAAATGQVTGRATLMVPTADAGELDGMQLEVRLEGLTPGAEHGWHFMMGRCDEEGTLVVGVSPGAEGVSARRTGAVAQPLSAGADGVAAQTALLPTAQVAAQELELRPYSVRVFDGLAPEPARMVACADLGSTGSPAQPR